MEKNQFKVTVNNDKRQEIAMKDLVENGSPEELAEFLRTTFDNAKVPLLKPEGYQTIKTKLPESNT